MSKLMYVLGIILLAAGLALAIMGLVNQAPLLARGIDMSSAISLIVGGILATGLAGVIGVLTYSGGYATHDEEPVAAEAKDTPVAVETTTTLSKTLHFPNFTRKNKDSTDVAAAAAAATAAESTADEVVTPAVKETISVLEQAKTELESAFSGGEVSSEAGSASDLYVVEDKVIRGRAARILSDGTVEAETEEGWMRFENLEHLDEYLDAVEQA